VHELRRRVIPVVILDRAGDQSEFCSVSVDDVEGGRLAVRHLIDQGHVRVGLVGGPGKLQQVRDRRMGAELAVSAGSGSVQSLVISTPHLDVESGVRAAQEIVTLPDWERPGAIFAANDLVAIGLLQGFVTAGLRVPDDTAIIGYDDIAFAAAAAVPLSSIRQPRRPWAPRRRAVVRRDQLAGFRHRPRPCPGALPTRTGSPRLQRGQAAAPRVRLRRADPSILMRARSPPSRTRSTRRLRGEAGA
jgi:LacI family transcriptional regulator